MVSVALFFVCTLKKITVQEVEFDVFEEGLRKIRKGSDEEIHEIATSTCFSILGGFAFLMTIPGVSQLFVNAWTGRALARSLCDTS